LWQKIIAAIGGTPEEKKTPTSEVEEGSIGSSGNKEGGPERKGGNKAEGKEVGGDDTYGETDYSFLNSKKTPSGELCLSLWVDSPAGGGKGGTSTKTPDDQNSSLGGKLVWGEGKKKKNEKTKIAPKRKGKKKKKEEPEGTNGERV